MSAEYDRQIQKLNGEVHRLKNEIFSMKNKFRNDEKEMLAIVKKMEDRMEILDKEIKRLTGGNND